MTTDVITLGQLDESSADHADFHYAVELANGPEIDDLWIALHTENLPAGCQVWFRLDGDHPVAVQPNTVTQDTFMVGTMVDAVPPDGAAPRRRTLLGSVTLRP